MKIDKDLDFLLNDILNKALIGKDRIVNPTSNKIGDFINEYIMSPREHLIIHLESFIVRAFNSSGFDMKTAIAIVSDNFLREFLEEENRNFKLVDIDTSLSYYNVAYRGVEFTIYKNSSLKGREIKLGFEI